jgi:Spy/CpxP family protein refolding chaperone
MRARLQIISLAFAVLMPFGAQAQSNKPAPVPRGEFHVGLHGPDIGLFAGIPLTDVQKSQTQYIMGLYRQQVKPVTAQLRSAEEQLRQLMLSPDALNVQEATALEKQVTQLNGELDDMALQALAQVRAQLTPTQLADAQSAYQERRAARQLELQSAAKK